MQQIASFGDDAIMHYMVSFMLSLMLYSLLQYFVGRSHISFTDDKETAYMLLPYHLFTIIIIDDLVECITHPFVIAYSMMPIFFLLQQLHFVTIKFILYNINIADFTTTTTIVTNACCLVTKLLTLTTIALARTNDRSITITYLWHCN